MRRFWFKLVAVAVVVAASFDAGLPLHEANAQTQVLTGAAKLSLVAAKFGTNIYWTADGLALAPPVQDKVIRSRGLRGHLRNRGSAPFDGATFYLLETGTKIRSLRAAIADEQGGEWEMTPEGGKVRAWGTTNISDWEFSSFPRRGKQFKLKFYAVGTSSREELAAEFKTANPAPGPYPVWRPMSMPATVTNGNLKTSLVTLISGFGVGPFSPWEKRGFTRAAFAVEENGQPTTDWVPHPIRATDATGNSLTDFRLVASGVKNGQVLFDLGQSSLSPGEVWRLKMEFKTERGSLGGGANARTFEFLVQPTRE